MTLGDPADVPQRVRRQHGDRHAGPLGGGPQPVGRPIGQPAPHRLLKKSVAQAERAGLAPPRIDEGPLARLTHREGAEDREAARKVPHGLEGHLGGVGSQPAGWITAASTPASSMRPTASSLRNEVTWRWAMLLGKPLPRDGSEHPRCASRFPFFVDCRLPTERQLDRHREYQPGERGDTLTLEAATPH
jgi:hypothetical protein